MGVCSVNLVVKQAMMPKIIPIRTPPKATIKKDVQPNTMSTGKILSVPISAKVSNKRYNTYERNNKTIETLRKVFWLSR